MITNANLFAAALYYFGLENVSHADNGMTERIRRAFNAAYQDIFLYPEAGQLRTQRAGYYLQKPAQITGCNFTAGSYTFTGGALQPWMVGCSFRISGELPDNRVTSWDGVNTGTLQNPIINPGLPGTGAIYQDAYLMPQNFLSFMGNCYLDGTWLELQPLQFRENQLYKEYPNRPIDGYGLQTAVVDRIRVGRPIGYWMIPAVVQNQGWYQQYLGVWPLPYQGHMIVFDIEINAPEITTTMLTGPSAATSYIPIPNGCHESVFLPLALLMLATEPHFQQSKAANLEPKSVVMERLSKMFPQRQAGSIMRPPYWMPLQHTYV